MEKKPEHAPRTNHSYELCVAAYGPIIDDANVIADVGAGDSPFGPEAEQRMPGKTVWRFDAQYASDPPLGERAVAADARYLDMVEDETFDVSVSAFMFQHITHGNGDVESAIKAMGRITKSTADPKDFSKGIIAIYPVWNEGNFMDQLAEAGLNDDNAVGVGYPGGDALAHFGVDYDLKTLVIRKTDSMSPERLEKIAKLIESDKILYKTETLTSFVRSAFIRATKRTRRNTSHTSRWY
jgi:hypothetical protein